MTPDVIDVLRRAPLFAEMDEAELAEVAAAMNECNAHPGEVVTAEDGPGDGFFVIDAGDAEVLVGGQVTGTMGAGDFFGEIALLTGGSRTATIRAVTDLRCYALTPWDFRTLVEDHPTIVWKALQAMAVRLA